MLAGCLPGYTRVTLLVSPETNQGRPLPVLVRAVDEQTYRSEPYAAVAALFVAADASVLKQVNLDPQSDKKEHLWIKRPADKLLAVYTLFTTPTGAWKLLLVPRLPCVVQIPLGRSGIRVEEVRECRHCL